MAFELGQQAVAKRFSGYACLVGQEENGSNCHLNSDLFRRKI
jgi:hypothetical protein